VLYLTAVHCVVMMKSLLPFTLSLLTSSFRCGGRYRRHGRAEIGTKQSSVAMSTVPVMDPTVIAMVLNESIPREYREQLLSSHFNEKVFKIQAEIEESHKETEVAKKETEAARKDVLAERLEKVKHEALLEKMYARATMMKPRSALEYVETHVMPMYNVTAGLGREEKWTMFLSTTPIGKDIATCISKEIPLWGSNAKAIAGHLKSMYQYSSEYHHETSLEIHETKSIEINRGQMLSQAFTVITCIAAICDLKVTS